MNEQKIRQLRVINRIRGIGQIASKNKTATEVVLEYFGISDEDYLSYGQIWREIGSAGKWSSRFLRHSFKHFLTLKVIVAFLTGNVFNMKFLRQFFIVFLRLIF